LLPLESIVLRPTGALYVPDWLGPEDHPWIEALLDELRRFEGRPTREWQHRALEPLRAETNERRRRLVVATLNALCEGAPDRGDRRPAALRAALFEAAQQGRAAGRSREQILSAVSTQLNTLPTELIDTLYAHLPAERPLLLPDPVPDPAALVRHTNQHVARSLIRSASQLEIRLASRSRPLIRQVLLRRLLATVHPHGVGARLDVSGPFSLFRHTTVYGRALASLLPVLRGADGFELLARCTLGSRPVTVRLGSGDPIFPPEAEPRRFDSKLEERFARDFAKLAPDWDLVREPEPVAVGGAWIFPDFALVHRVSRQRWLLEIVGFWTPAYLEAKLDRLRRAGRQDLIVAVDEKLGCDAAEPPALPHLVRFRGRVDAAAILAILERTTTPPAPAPTVRRLIQP
jgi:predicted nuclease of restriction endonuclease-like RecB superfamily